MDVLKRAREIIEKEIEALEGLKDSLGDPFEKAIELLFSTRGKVVVTGMGKSGIVARKISSTLSSTGTPSTFLHPGEGGHGDLGVISRGDTVLAVSHSGETEEIIRLIPFIRNMGVPIISIVGDRNSTLGRLSDVALETGVKEEACKFNLVPTSSTTASLALGDAIAICLFEKKGLTEKDFAFYHPLGALGKRLLLRVGDIMHTGSEIPFVKVGTPMRDVIVEMTVKGLGITGVLNENGRLVGVVTDGDLRRALNRGSGKLLDEPVDIYMTTNPKRINKGSLVVSALRKMEEHKITSLFVYEDDEDPDIVVGIIHIHDILREGIR